MSTAASSPSSGQRKRTFKGKSSQGCQICKNRHVKCDEGKPICNNCRRLNRVCVQRDGSSADPRGQAGASTISGPLTTTPAQAGNLTASAANAAAAGSAGVIDATGAVEDSQMDESTQDHQDGNDTNPSRNTPSSINPQEAINKTDSSDTTFTQSLQREAPPNTRVAGPNTTGIKRPFSTISTTTSADHQSTMADDKRSTISKQSNEAMENNVDSSTSHDPLSKVSTMTNATNNNSPRPPGQSTINSSNEVKHRAPRLVNAPLSSISRAGNSFSAISSIESTPETPTLSDSNTLTSAAMPTPNSNGDPTQGSTTQSSSTQSDITQGTNTQNITESKSSTMANSNTTEPPTYAQVTAASGPRSTTTTAPITPIYPSLGIPQPQPRYHTPLSLASTSTNRPPGLNFTPLRPITHWVPPRPAIISRTERSAAEIADDIADEEARKAEKKAEAERKEAEIKLLREAAKRAEKAAEVERARVLGRQGFGMEGKWK